MQVKFFFQLEDDAFGQRTLDSVPRVGETVTINDRLGEVLHVDWADIVDGKGVPLGGSWMEVQITLKDCGRRKDHDN